MSRSIIAALVLLTGCSGDSPNEPTPVVPANVVFRSTEHVNQIGGIRVTATLSNTGGPGTFKLQAHFWRTCATCVPPDPMDSESYDVAAGWQDSSTWEVEPRPRYIYVLTRDTGSITWRQTDGVEIECC